MLTTYMSAARRIESLAQVVFLESTCDMGHMMYNVSGGCGTPESGSRRNNFTKHGHDSRPV